MYTVVGTLEICIATSNEERCLANLRLMLSHCVTNPAVTVVGDECTINNAQMALELPNACSVQTSSSTKRCGPVASLQRGYKHTTAPIIAFIHDDVEIFEDGWDAAVLEEFNRPNVGVVGFGGATGLGSPDIYKVPYQLQQLARYGYASNDTDWKTHGGHFTGSREVAVLDGFCLIVRRELLDKCGGWPVTKMLFHNYDFYLCAIARRMGYKVRQIGVHCHHSGGLTSTTANYNNWIMREHGRTDSEEHSRAHTFCWEEFRDVLPIRV